MVSGQLGLYLTCNTFSICKTLSTRTDTEAALVDRPPEYILKAPLSKQIDEERQVKTNPENNHG